MKRFIALAVLSAVAYLAVPLGAGAQTGPDIDNRTPVNPYGVKPDGTKAQFRLTDAGEALISGAVEATIKGSLPDGGSGTVLLDQAHRQIVALGTTPGACLGAHATASAGAGPTLAAGTEYRLCALSDLWIRYDGEAATTDAPSEPLFARTCLIRGPFAAERSTSVILTGTVLAGSEIVACPQARVQ